jgi:hypothetical protein
MLEDLEKLKAEGLTGGVMAIGFTRRLIQPIQDQVHPAYEYWGQSDPTRAVKRKVSKDGMAVQVKNIFVGRIRNRECPKAVDVYQPPGAVCLRPCLLSIRELAHF